MYKASVAAWTSSLLAASAAALAPVTTQGQDFVVNGERFEIIGIDYQPGGQGAYQEGGTSDVLSDPTACLRDAILMQMLGINTIRVYILNPYLNHDECASIFDSAGIYMMLDVNSPHESIHYGDPGPSYNLGYLNRTFALMDAFRGYENTLAFFSANELVSDQSGGTALTDPPYIRAVIRDLKQYLAKHSARQIPVGYANTDNDQILVDMINYVQCNLTDSPDSRADFFGLNDYQWCGPSKDFSTSGYELLTEQFADISIPPIFSEYGCNKGEVDGHRDFPEVPVLYSSQMAVFSGGLIYEFTEEGDQYGLVDLSDDKVKLLPDFTSLQLAFQRINSTQVTTSNGTATNVKAPICSPGLIQNPKAFSNNFDLPAQPSGLADLIESGTGNRVGKLSQPTATAQPVPYTNYTGTEITGLALNATKVSNAPSGVKPAGGPATSSGAAAVNTVEMTGALGLLGILMVFLA